MRKTNLKFILITLLFITSISFLGWNGAFNQVSDTNRLFQINKADDLSSEDLSLIIHESDVDYSDLYPDNLPERDYSRNNFEQTPLKSEYESPDMPKLSIEFVQYVSRGVISLTGDNDPLWQNFTGNGTLSSPYLIQDFEITANHTHLIYIQDTTVHFTIAQNLLDGVSGIFNGIYLNNVTNGLIYDNSIGFTSFGIRVDESDGINMSENYVHNNSQNGITLLNSEGNFVGSNIVSNGGTGVLLNNSDYNWFGLNLITHNLENGIFLENSSYNEIVYNEIFHNGFGGFTAPINNGEIRFSVQGASSGHGIYLDPSHHNFIEGNVIYNNFANGLTLYQSDDSTIVRNHVFKNENGIFLEDSGHNNISWNTVFKNGLFEGDTKLGNGDIKFSVTGSSSGHGIYLDPSDFNLVEHNNIHSNQGAGVYIVDSDSTKVLKNLFSVNGFYGVYIDMYSSESIVSQNDFLLNNLGAESQVFDDGIENFFDGNYWSDHSEGEYYIDGEAKNKDTNPAANTIINPEYEFSPPTVVRPNGEETLSGIAKIEWIGAESEISLPLEMKYYVFYSSDGGETWHHVYFSFEDDSTIISSGDGKVKITIVWDTTNFVDGSVYLIQVIAIDGAGFVMFDTSDNVFNIKNGDKPTTTTTTTTTVPETTTPSLTSSWTTFLTISGLGIYIVIRRRKQP